MTAQTTTPPDQDRVRAAAAELLARYGAPRAIDEARRRAEDFARERHWPEHAVAMRLLTVVEQLAGRA